MVIRIKQIDAFTQQAFQGNPAGVVIDAELLKDSEIQLIAREMNLSETAFICPLSDEDVEADFRLRWFTPTTEVDLCGHATIAALHALAEEGRFGLEGGVEQRLRLETRSGILTVDVEWDDEHPIIYFSIPIPEFTEFEGTDEAAVHAIGLETGDLDPRGTLLQAGNGYLYMPIQSREALYQAKPDKQQLLHLHHSYQTCGVTCVTTDTNPNLYQTDKLDWELRFFAPALGVLEDPVTGSANGPTLPYLQEMGILESVQHLAYGGQGVALHRPGVVQIEQRYSKKKHEELLIAGQARTVLEGTIRF
ncbi:MAG: PhzF family phenazine biosynthesis protein [Bacteroidota bacterium]